MQTNSLGEQFHAHLNLRTCLFLVVLCKALRSACLSYDGSCNQIHNLSRESQNVLSLRGTSLIIVPSQNSSRQTTFYRQLLIFCLCLRLSPSNLCRRYWGAHRNKGLCRLNQTGQKLSFFKSRLQLQVARCRAVCYMYNIYNKWMCRYRYIRYIEVAIASVGGF